MKNQMRSFNFFSKYSLVTAMLLWFSLVSFDAQAGSVRNTPQCQALTEGLFPHLDLARSGYDETGLKLYHFGLCWRNIWLLSQRLLERGVSLERASVLFIERFDRQSFRTLKNRPPPTKMGTSDGKQGDFQWDGLFGFHVVLEFDGLILDHDFDNHTRVVPIKEYFTEMFGGDGDLKVSVVPAQEYASETRIVHQSYLKAGAYPTYSFAEFVEMKALSANCSEL